jgi:hypothetical protein
MLLTNHYKLDDICEELNKRGNVRESGRTWAWKNTKNPVRITVRNQLHEIFNKPFNAGWVASWRFDIKMGEIRGQW